MIFIWLIISVVINIILLLIFIKEKKKKSNNIILKEILDKVSKNDTNFIDSSARYIIEVLKKHYKIDYCTIFVRDNTRLEIIATNVEELNKEEVTDHCISLLNKNINSAIISEGDTYLDYKAAEKRKIKYSYFIKLSNIGALYIENKVNYNDNSFELEFFKVIVKNITIILQNCIYQDEISKMAMRDNLTNIYNRNYMYKHLNLLVKGKGNLVLAIMDIDYFKKVNDTYGHDLGDVVLKEISKFMKNNLSKNDEIYRYGGEEFIISFYKQNIEEVEYKLNNIREELSKLKIKDENSNLSINVTASFGLSEFNKNRTIDDTIKRADLGLYQSKKTGRNKVTLYP